ncbi:carboxyvinyl-carboxyphosphonate phosphorylmutase [mine drainage metagenome]|uniref:Carboxyvinyl-carboxyphosphonate phosphorylmutase n=1 Tax=mine drainage metagenome TaxID=410659 RepID=A0A1J5SGC9_9ZZZZ
MNIEVQIRKAQAFRKMHDRSAVLVLPNAWDAVTARLFAQLGFAAVATTSGGVAWSLGYADGEHAPLSEVIAASKRIAHAVDLPVTVDIETGYGTTPEAVADTVSALIAAGAVGINLEDGLHDGGTLREMEVAVARIRAARSAAAAAGVPVVINARTDTYRLKYGATDGERFDETVRRAKAYLAAGADCIYPIGLGDAATIGDLVQELDAPVNVSAWPGTPSVSELAHLGVARVSTATRLATLALSAVERAAKELRASGRFECLEATLTHPGVQRLFSEI